LMQYHPGRPRRGFVKGVYCDLDGVEFDNLGEDGNGDGGLAEAADESAAVLFAGEDNDVDEADLPRVP